jgi:ribosomal protein S18 acetylase RimI-like enzyme
MLVRLAAQHRGPLVDLLERTPEFDAADREVALELIDLGIAGSHDYRFWVDVADGSTPGRPDVRGYICFGPTPMTRGTFDLYWIAVHPAHRGAGVGKLLVARMEEEIASEGARLVRVETEGNAEYAATRLFYERIGYLVVARIRDFYDADNDLYIWGKYFKPR